MRSRAELIESLEKAPRGTRELDASITATLPGGYTNLFTQSLEAALTLVPKGVLWTVGINKDKGTGEPFAFAQLSDNGKITQEVIAATPELALCIAVLKTSEEME